MNLNSSLPNNCVLPEYFGWFRPYWVFFLSGFLLGFLLAILEAKRKNLPLKPLENFIIFALPISVVSSSFFGKLNFFNNTQPFYQLFFFWQAGLSVHGAIIGASIFAFCYFYFTREKYQISTMVYIDILAPNALIAQAIGRWGNFFNHEILGIQTSYQALSWLPSFIRNSLIKVHFNQTTNQFVTNHPLVFYQPLFLYESILDLCFFLLINLFFKKYIYLFFKTPLKINDQKCFRLKYLFHNLCFKNNKVKYLGFKQTWNNLYFEYEVPKNLLKSIKITKYNNNSKSKIKNYFNFVTKQNSKEIKNLNNPYQVPIIYCGVFSGLYYFFYDLIRICLEWQRQRVELFIINSYVLSYIFLISFALFGLFLTIFMQFISPNKYRKQNFYYEKQF